MAFNIGTNNKYDFNFTEQLTLSFITNNMACKEKEQQVVHDYQCILYYSVSAYFDWRFCEINQILG